MISHLRRLTLTDIKRELFDKDILEGISEWKDFNTEDMIHDDWSRLLISVKGIDLLKNKKSRKILNNTLTEIELDKLRKCYGDNALSSSQICSKIAKEPWEKTNVMKTYLSFFGYNEEYLNKGEEMPASINVKNNERFFELLDYQYVIRQKILYQLRRDKHLTKMLVQMPTGTGKTKTTMHTLVNYYVNDLNSKGLILWLAHTSVLVEQALDTLTKVWTVLGKGGANIYRLYGGYNFSGDSNGFVFSTFDKLLSLKKVNSTSYDFIKNNVSVIVVDEVHRAVAPKIKECLKDLMVLYNNCDRKLIGLTATIGRSNTEVSENYKIVDMFDGNIIKIDVNLLNKINFPERIAEIKNSNDRDIIHYLQKRKILSKLEREELEYQNYMNQDELKELLSEISTRGRSKTDFSAKIVTKLAINRKRNEAIIRKIQKLHEERRPTIVFACSVSHAKLLSAILFAKGIKNSLVYGDQSIKEKNEAIEAFKNANNDINIIINYEVLTTGFDSTNIECVLITRPTKSIVLYSQMIGRGLRGPLMGGNERCLLVDVKDNLESYTDESAAFNYFDSYWK